jgi:DNA-binding transcriptional MerR regulator
MRAARRGPSWSIDDLRTSARSNRLRTRRAVRSACPGPLPPPARTESGYRDYEPDTVERIRLRRELRAIGLTLNDAVDALAAHDAGGATCESERWRLQAVLDRVDARLVELTALRGRIVEAQEACASGRCTFTSRRSS